MYVRFITPWWRLPRGADCGLFGPAYACAWDMRVPAVLREALWIEIEWFDHVPAFAKRVGITRLGMIDIALRGAVGVRCGLGGMTVRAAVSAAVRVRIDAARSDNGSVTIRVPTQR